MYNAGREVISRGIQGSVIKINQRTDVECGVFVCLEGDYKIT
jgi:hypothetical protein